jgi:hypothetical protein
VSEDALSEAAPIIIAANARIIIAPNARRGKNAASSAIETQLLLSGIDWRHPQYTWRPTRWGDARLTRAPWHEHGSSIFALRPRMGDGECQVSD